MLRRDNPTFRILLIFMYIVYNKTKSPNEFLGPDSGVCGITDPIVKNAGCHFRSPDSRFVILNREVAGLKHGIFLLIWVLLYSLKITDTQVSHINPIQKREKRKKKKSHTCMQEPPKSSTEKRILKLKSTKPKQRHQPSNSEDHETQSIPNPNNPPGSPLSVSNHRSQSRAHGAR